MSNLSVLLAGGGTGGHIFPAISLYEEFTTKGINASMLVGKKDIGFSPLSGIDKNHIYIYRAPSFTKNIIKVPFFVISFSLAIFRAMMLIKRVKANAVIGMGGYVSAPALVASVFLKIPVFLCEQNSIPGKVTVLFAGKAKKIFTTFYVTKDYIKDKAKPKVVHAGNPIRKNILIKATRQEAKKAFHLNHCKKVILVIGGSQGALKINELFLEIKKIFSNELKDVGVIWTAGEYSFQRFKDALSKMGGNGSVYLSSFIDNIGLAYKASDLALSRSGAGGVVEFAAAGLPSILIPYPHAADNHQEKNAEEFERAGASVRIRREETDPEKVGNVVMDLLSNPNQLARMSEKAKSLAKIDASKDIMNAIIKEL